MRENAPTGIGHRIREIRKASGISQYVLSDLTGITQASISRFEKQQFDVNTSQIVAIAKALDVSVGELFGETPADVSVSQEALAIAKTWEELPSEQKLAVKVMIDSLKK